jgi:hypothetical protein
MMDESVCWTKKRQQAARNFNHLNENPGTEAKSGKIKSSFGVFQQTAKMLWPVAMQPDNASGPSHHARNSCTSAKGDMFPVWPPAPVQTAIRPSTPASAHLCAWRLLMISLKTKPP